MNLAEQEIQVSQIVYEEKVKNPPGQCTLNLENVLYCTLSKFSLENFFKGHNQPKTRFFTWCRIERLSQRRQWIKINRTGLHAFGTDFSGDNSKPTDIILFKILDSFSINNVFWRVFCSNLLQEN